MWSSNYRAEVLAYEIDQKLGFNLVPPTVVRTVDGQVGSIQLFKGSVKGAAPGLIEYLGKEDAEPFLYRMRSLLRYEEKMK